MKARLDKYTPHTGTYGQHGFTVRSARKQPRSYLGAYIIGLVLLALLANLAYYLS